MKSRKGFTLVELIVTITLLALFGVTIGITLNKTFKKQQEKEYKEFVSKIESSANLYLNNNYELLNQLYENKGYIYITVSELTNSGLLYNNLINSETNQPVGSDELIKVSLDSSGVIKITYPAPENNEPYLQTIDIMLNAGSTEPPEGYCWYGLNTVSLGYIDKDGNLDSSYLIKNTNIKCSIKNNSTISTNKVGTYELKYEYQTPEGKWKSTTRKVIIVDKTEPSCGTIEGASTTWIKENRIIKVNCTDEHSGCIKNPFIHTFTETTKDSNIIIKDKSGNTTSCPVDVYVDKTAPSCGTIEGASTTWTKDNRTISVGCTDAHSGCPADTTFSQTYSSTTKDANIEIKDKVGNKNSCKVNVYVDKTAPSCGTITGQSTTWTNGNRTITVGCTDEHSGCEEASYSNTYSSTTKTSNITIKDKAGNTQSCSVNAYVDKTTPTCGTITGQSTNWTAGNRTITVGCTDEHSGCEEASYSTTYSSTTKEANIEIKDKVGNTKNCKVNVYVDKTAPTCKLKVTTSGIEFESKDDNVELANFGMGTSSTANYNSKTSLALATGKFYGYVKDKAGNTGSCSITLSSTKVSEYKKKTRTCNRSVSTYKCTRAYDKCPSGYSAYSGGSYDCRQHTSTTYYYTKKTTKCSGTVNTTYTNATGNNCINLTSESKCKGKSGCTWRTTGGSAKPCYGTYYTCSSGVLSGTQCKHTSTSYSTSSSSATNVTSCSAVTSFSTCNVNSSGKSNISCTQTSSTKNYSYKNYSACTEGTVSDGQCVKTGQTSTISGWSCSAETYNYAFGNYGSESTVSSCTASSFSCNSSNYGSTYTSCTASKYTCADSGYTKLNNSYCYKIN